MGHLNLEDKITKYWPEFGQNGKDKLTIDQLMRHETGLVTLTDKIDLEWCTSQNLKDNAIGENIEKDCSVWIEPENQENPGSKRERLYHAMTRGLINNEIFRRVEP